MNTGADLPSDVLSDRDSISIFTPRNSPYYILPTSNFHALKQVFDCRTGPSYIILDSLRSLVLRLPAFHASRGSILDEEIHSRSASSGDVYDDRKSVHL